MNRYGTGVLDEYGREEVCALYPDDAIAYAQLLANRCGARVAVYQWPDTGDLLFPHALWVNNELTTFALAVPACRL